MFSDQNIDDFLFEIIFHVLFVESGEGFEPVVDHAFHVSFTCSGDIGMGGAGTGVMFGDLVAVIGPCVFQVDDQRVGRLGVIGC